MPFDAAAVCGSVVAALRQAIARDWQRVTVRLEGMDGTCASWFRGPNMALEEGEFAARWAAGSVLCATQGEQLQLRLSLAHPVPAPAPTFPAPDPAPAADPQAAAVPALVEL